MTEVARDTKEIEETASVVVEALAGQLADEIMKKLPANDLTAAIDKEVIRKGIHNALSPEVAKFVKGKMDKVKGAIKEGTEASIASAGELISGLTTCLDEVRSYISGASKTGHTTAEERMSALLKKIGFKRLENGGAEVTVPQCMTIEEFGKKANVICKELGIRPAFYEEQSDFWQQEESDPSTQTVANVKYRFRVEDKLVRKTRRDQLEILASGGREMPPIGALAMATICVHIQSQGQEDFLKNLWVRASAFGVALRSRDGGVGVFFGSTFGEWSDPHVTCAASVE